MNKKSPYRRGIQGKESQDEDQKDAEGKIISTRVRITGRDSQKQEHEFRDPKDKHHHQLDHIIMN